MAKFKVVSVRKQDRLRADGGITIVYRVWLETGRGSSAAVDVPESIYEGDGLKSYLEQQAALLDRAFDLALE